MINKNVIMLTLLVITLFGICLIYADQIIRPAGVYVDQTRNTDGTFNFTVRTVTYNGSYAPHNVGAIWITNSSNQFVKTIKVWAQEHRSALIRWLASSGNNTVGAITSATLNSHQLHNVSWNGTNVSNALVADGDYKVNVEFAEHSASSSNMGKYTVHTFNKGSTLIDQVIPNESYFQNMHLVWTPVIVGNVDDTDPMPANDLYNYPNPFNSYTVIQYYLPKETFVSLAVFDLKGRLIKNLVKESLSQGWHESLFNSQDSHHNKLASGKYLYKLDSDGKVKIGTMVLIKQ